MRTAYIGPKHREQALQAFVGPGFTMEAHLPAGMPQSIESMGEEYLSVPEFLEEAVDFERDGVDAIVHGCFGDPGIDRARELVSIPVLGSGATPMRIAANLSHRFSIITVLESIIRPLANLARLTGVGSKLASVRQIGIPALELSQDPDGTLTQLLNASRTVIEDDRADALVLGCGTVSLRAGELQERVGVPVLNPLQVTLGAAELLLSCGLSHSKRSYPAPPKLAVSLRRAAS